MAMPPVGPGQNPQDPQLPPPNFGQPQYAPPGYFSPSVPPKKNWFARHKAITVIGAFVAIGAVGSAAGGAKNESATPTAAINTSAATSAGVTTSAPAQTTADPVRTTPAPARTTSAATKAAPKPDPTTAAAPDPDPTTEDAPVDNGPVYTVAQENAIRSAEDYLSMDSGFSRAGLIDQLHSDAGEGYKLADAVFAVNHIDVDWNEQAVLSAKGYLDMMGFSRSGLIEQLSSEYGSQFTVAQATYAAKKVGL